MEKNIINKNGQYIQFNFKKIKKQIQWTIDITPNIDLNEKLIQIAHKTIKGN